MFKLFILLGALNAGLSVVLGAFGAHGLESKLSAKMMDVYKTGVQYHIFHALGLFVVAFLADKFPNSSLIGAAGWIMFLGIILFSGSLYVLSVTDISKLGIITPFGGLAFIISWVLIIIAILKV
ncbi:DUF423 domain-containing protein [Pseudalkalibacillus salsuginis]|uniref:DUF423 domain-containing protein n=1 Tax=Pseudalkalibacillus salsuginis TaxID=2910972 RepID=UPI001F23FA07|nr:DUF423 domain-containing protein [Pseudalkalibacillus salsuginis]MCF6410861.1 DUF423 domain-containing protein [Pseudalkalibacillus salsuginis]